MVNFDAIKELARQALKDPSEPEVPPGISDGVIDEFEIRTGLVVPTDLRKWLRFSNGSSLGAGGIRGIDTPHPGDDVDDDYNLHPSWRDKGWIPVAGDGCGNYYVLATRSEDGPGNPAGPARTFMTIG